jgi:hypothetical protein
VIFDEKGVDCSDSALSRRLGDKQFHTVGFLTVGWRLVGLVVDEEERYGYAHMTHVQRRHIPDFADDFVLVGDCGFEVPSMRVEDLFVVILCRQGWFGFGFLGLA